VRCHIFICFICSCVMCPDGYYTDNIDLSYNPNLLTLSLQHSRHTPQRFVRLLSGLVTPNLQQVTLHLDDDPRPHESDDWLEIHRVLNGQASVCLVEIVQNTDPSYPTLRRTFAEYFPLLWSRGILKSTYLLRYRWSFFRLPTSQ
jgi:hypothetical protein